MSRFAAAVLLAFALPLALAAQAPPPPAIQPALSFEPQAVIVSGATHGGKVVWLEVARVLSEYSATLVRHDGVTSDDDADGTVRLDLDEPVPPVSIWIAVDLATGEWTAATPGSFPLRLVPPERRHPGRGAPGRPSWVEAGRSLVDLQVVRPGQGAWGQTLGDGGEDDDDGQPDGRLTASLAHMRALPGSPAAPDHFSPKDVVAGGASCRPRRIRRRGRAARAMCCTRTTTPAATPGTSWTGRTT
jgi:hypothetical protein